MRLKREAPDANFSDAVRWSYDWRCQFTEVQDDGTIWQCEMEWPEAKAQDAHCSHHISRKYSSVRWFPDNAVLLCASHHAIVTDFPGLHAAFYRRHLGDVRYEELQQRARRIFRYRAKDKDAISKHFIAEKRRIIELRSQGVRGPVELLSYD